PLGDDDAIRCALENEGFPRERQRRPLDGRRLLRLAGRRQPLADPALLVADLPAPFLTKRGRESSSSAARYSRSPYRLAISRVVERSFSISPRRRVLSSLTRLLIWPRMPRKAGSP